MELYFNEVHFLLKIPCINNSHIGDHTLHGKESQYSILGSRDDLVVIALASHLRGPGSGHEWVKLVVGSLLCYKRFFSGFSGFPLNISKFQFNRMQDLPENHFRVSGASWVNINNNNNNYYYYFFHYYSIGPKGIANTVSLVKILPRILSRSY